MIIDRFVTDRSKIKDLLSQRRPKIYFIGIGGVSMSSLAEYCFVKGYFVTGSDVRESPSVVRLRSLGIRISIGHSRERMMLEAPDLVVYSFSISEDDPELTMAKRMEIPCVCRAELLSAVIAEYRTSVGVIGTHGKSTVTAMLYKILERDGKRPGLFLGASGEGIPPFVEGGSDILVYEGCEYRDSFLRFKPTVNLVLNVDLDHTDYFHSFEDYAASFSKAAELSRELTLINASDPGAASIIGSIRNRCVTFSEREGCDYRYVLTLVDTEYLVSIFKEEKLIASFIPGAPGKHNAVNAAAAAIAAYTVGASSGSIEGAIREFRGLGRRLEKIGHLGSSDVYYDYAHHPTEIAALESALRQMGYKNIMAVFAPHTYTRTRDLMQKTAEALARFESSLVTEIYGAREDPIVGVSSYALAEKVRSIGAKSVSVTQKEAFSLLNGSSFDCIALIGAGELEQIKKKIEEQ